MKRWIFLLVIVFVIILALSLRLALQKQEITVLVWSHFIPDVDRVLKKHAEEFGAAKGIKVRIDTIDLQQFAAIKAAEAQAKSGHDIIMNYGADPMLYDELLANVSDLVNDLSDAYGGLIPLATETGRVGSQWKSVPWYYYSYPLVIRTDLITQVGEHAPETWEDMLRIGTKLKKIGKPLGIQLGHSRDGNGAMLALMWGYGAAITAQDGNTVTINSPETIKAVEFVKRLYTDAMDPEVISWDDAANNRAVLAGTCSMTLNSPSIYQAARENDIRVAETDKPLAETIDHILPPAGPQGRFAFTDCLTLGIWEFSKNKELAKEFLKYHFARKQFEEFLEVAMGYNVPFLQNYRSQAVFTSDPKIRFIGEIGKYEHTIGYPGPVTAQGQLVWDKYIISDMFAYAATGRMSPQEAVEWAEKEIKAIYGGKAGQ